MQAIACFSVELGNKLGNEPLKIDPAVRGTGEAYGLRRQLHCEAGMAGLSDNVLKRTQALVSTAPHHRLNTNRSLDATAEQAECIGWLASAANLIEKLIPDPTNSYRKLAAEKQLQANALPYQAHMFASHLEAALRLLALDADAGLLASIEARVSGETFDDLLDHSAAYLEDSRHQPAGVLAGVVFEDTIRRLCDAHDIEHRGKELDTALSALKSKNVLTKLEQKEGIAAADLRAKATHADWKAFNADQVASVIAFTRRLIREKLAI